MTGNDFDLLRSDRRIVWPRARPAERQLAAAVRLNEILSCENGIFVADAAPSAQQDGVALACMHCGVCRANRDPEQDMTWRHDFLDSDQMAPSVWKWCSLSKAPASIWCPSWRLGSKNGSLIIGCGTFRSAGLFRRLRCGSGGFASVATFVARPTSRQAWFEVVEGLARVTPERGLADGVSNDSGYGECQ